MKKGPQKYIKTKVIECVVLLEKPKNRLMEFIIIGDSIDSVVLDLQEIYPNENITRKSILKWEFLTVEKAKKKGLLTKGKTLVLNSYPNPQETNPTEVK